MVQIPFPSQQVGVDRTPQPKVSPSIFTADVQAIARTGQAVAGVSQLLENVQGRLARAETRSIDADLTAQLAEINTRRSDPEWRDQNYGMGPLLTASPDGTTTVRVRKPLTDFTSDWEAEVDSAIETATGKFTLTPRVMKDVAITQWQQNKIRQGVRVNSIMVQMSEEASALAVHKQIQAILLSSEAPVVALKALKRDLERTGDLHKTVQNEKMFDRFIAQAKKIESNQLGDAILVAALALPKEEGRSLINLKTKGLPRAVRNDTLARYEREIARRGRETVAQISDQASNMDYNKAITFINSHPDLNFTEKNALVTERGRQRAVRDRELQEETIELLDPLPLAEARKAISKIKDKTLRTSMKAWADTKDVALQEEAELKADVAREELDKLFVAKTLTWDVVEASDLPNKEKLPYWEGYLQHIRILANNQKSPFEETDQETKSDVMVRIDTDTDNIAEEEIYTFRGKGKNGGLSNIDIGQLVTRLRTAKAADSQNKRDVVDRGYKVLENTKNIQVALLKADRKGITEITKEAVLPSNLRKQQFADWLEIESRTDEEVNKKIELLLGPANDQIKLGLWEGIVLKDPAEKRLLTRRRVSQLITDGIWAKWTPDQKNLAIRLFNEGNSIPSVRNAVNNLKNK